MSVLIIQFLNKKLSEIPVGSGGSYKHGDKMFENNIGYWKSIFLMNLMSCNGILKNINSVVILKCPKRMFE